MLQRNGIIYHIDSLAGASGGGQFIYVVSPDQFIEKAVELAVQLRPWPWATSRCAPPAGVRRASLAALQLMAARGARGGSARAASVPSVRARRSAEVAHERVQRAVSQVLGHSVRVRQRSTSAARRMV